MFDVSTRIVMKILLAPLDPVHDAGLKLIKR